MPSKPRRPEPSEKVLDYDDGDPYSCMAAGREEDRLQQLLEHQVEACFQGPADDLEHLARRDLASVRTALYDVWDRSRRERSTRPKARWAAERLASLGFPDVLRYEESQG